MKFLLPLVLLLLHNSVAAQQQEFSLGAGGQSYSNFSEERGSTSSSSRMSFIAGAGYSTLKKDSLTKFRYTVHFWSVNTNVSTIIMGLGGGGDFEAGIRKNLLVFSFYPLNFGKRFTLSAGLQAAITIYDRSEGSQSSWTLGNWPPGEALKGKDINYLTFLSLALQAGYRFPLNNSCSIAPRVHLSTNLTPEINTLWIPCQSLRASFEIALFRHL